MDVDGNLRLYSFDPEYRMWNITWMAVAEQCRVHGLCGLNGLCIYTPQPTCVCPPGFEMVDSADWFKGCQPINKLACNPNTTHFVRLQSADYYGSDNSSTEGKSLEQCRKSCLDDCDCLGFGYRLTGRGQCYLKFLPVNGYQSPGVINDVYVKVSINDSSAIRALSMSGSSLYCSNQTQPNDNISFTVPRRKREELIVPLASIASSIGFTEIVCMAIGWWILFRNFDEDNFFKRQGYFAAPTGLKRFTFPELREATGNFTDMVGKGGFGSVYKGRLRPENKVVAVKRLEGVFQGEDEFWAEVSMICRVNHMNLVRMFGFCAEGKHRMLVYEYVENGSLDKYLFTHNSNSSSSISSSMVLDWKKRLQIAIGAAKGLAYLHEECLEWILHCDVKPQNILLDDKFRAKVSDFGLAKLVDSGHDRDRALSFSTIRGTRGYLAPEWTMNLPISAKADIYSFGIVLLELVSGRDAAKFNMPESGLTFVRWVAENMKAGKWMNEVVDAKLADAGELNSEEMERMLNTALLCVKQERDQRPSMGQIIEMLMGVGPITSETGNGMEYTCWKV
ncbi:putative receptor protein kinase ZmPK1 [Cryptomeria japonica]|uniref:putative receptor protein kinase ZmPK1 n=1 Tax=Cryptomeria japonica TaxID=3369 RepID=UPI0027D9EFBD|nr:putative receptor protein kinase ZmPK1 [Cryptomeria japonica]